MDARVLQGKGPFAVGAFSLRILIYVIDLLNCHVYAQLRIQRHFPRVSSFTIVLILFAYVATSRSM